MSVTGRRPVMPYRVTVAAILLFWGATVLF